MQESWSRLWSQELNPLECLKPPNLHRQLRLFPSSSITAGPLHFPVLKLCSQSLGPGGEQKGGSRTHRSTLRTGAWNCNHLLGKGAPTQWRRWGKGSKVRPLHTLGTRWATHNRQCTEHYLIVIY